FRRAFFGWNSDRFAALGAFHRLAGEFVADLERLTAPTLDLNRHRLPRRLVRRTVTGKET
ncbi:MAG: hypothetical protein AAGC97_13480, partial [Planctomycetota bacterium]